MKTKGIGLHLIFVWLISLTACSGGSERGPETSVGGAVGSPAAATVYRQPKFAVEMVSDITYALGQVHESWRGRVSGTKDLMLDAYRPVGAVGRLPVVTFVHGGGFRDGDKTDGAAKYFGDYFASRGFLVISVNYRLMDEYGTVPEAIAQYVNGMALSDYKKNQHKAMYPAVRDVKAALRWLANQATTWQVDLTRVAIIGNSAGAIIGIAVGATDPDDFATELSLAEDPTLSSTHQAQSLPRIRAVVDFWGSGDAVDLYEGAYQTTRWRATNAPLMIVHGTDDATIAYDEALYLQQRYQRSGAPYQFCGLAGMGHGAWDGVCDGKTLDVLALEFIAKHLQLTVVEH